MDGVMIRVRLVGRKVYERPVSVALGDQIPRIGDFLEIPLAGRMVRVRVTSSSPPICRRDVVTYLVYAIEPELRAG